MYVEEKLKAEIVAEALAKKWFGHLGAARWPNVRSRRAACRFALRFLYLRNVKRFGWNHKREYRIYRELELKLRIEPRKRLVRDEPQALTVSSRINEFWSMDIMHDMLDDGRAIRLFNVSRVPQFSSVVVV